MGEDTLVLDFDGNYPGTPEEQAAVRAALVSQQMSGYVYVALSRLEKGWHISMARRMEQPFRVVAGLIESPTRDEGGDFTTWIESWLRAAGVPLQRLGE